MTRVTRARGAMLHTLDLFAFDGIYTPWDRIYIRPGCEGDGELIAHEIAHRAQRRRDGWWYFWPTICLDYIVTGYERSPYEIEAREASRDWTHPVWQYDRPD